MMVSIFIIRLTIRGERENKRVKEDAYRMATEGNSGSGRERGIWIVWRFRPTLPGFLWRFSCSPQIASLTGV
jgi:hypothetical protein